MRQWEQVAPMADGQLAAAYVYCRGGGEPHHAAFHARMFAPAKGSAEDPATGAAAGGAVGRDPPLTGCAKATMRW
jgi:trans-2,3-dihydro-3-hydroxyanthranilate isomerase